jgi:rhomboid protease GluP
MQNESLDEGNRVPQLHVDDITLQPTEVASAQVEVLDTPSWEEFRPRPRKPKTPFQKIPHSRFFIPGVIGVFLFTMASLYETFSDKVSLVVSGQSIYQNVELWRLFTALFVHADFSHLTMNSLYFLVFGWLLRSYFGSLYFPLLPLLIGVLSNAVTVYFYDPRVSLIGASGMVYGMVALWLVLYMKFDVNIKASMRLVRAFGYTLIMLIPSSYDPNTSYLAHTAGFSIGIVTGIMASPLAKLHDPISGEISTPPPEPKPQWAPA